MKPIISLERREAILALANKRTQTICTLMDNNHVDGYDEILRLVDRPVGTPEELKTAIMNRDVEEAERFMRVIKQAMKEYI